MAATPARLRRLADLLDRVDEDGVEVRDVESARIRHKDELRATVELRIGDVPGDGSATNSSLPSCFRCGADLDEDWLKESNGDGGPAPCPACGDNPLPPVGGTVAADVEPAEAENGLEEDEQQSVRPTEDESESDEDSEDEMACSECGESHDDGACWDDPLVEEIVSILEAEGEVRSSDLRDRVDGNSTEFYDACDDLKAADRLSVRDDPDDGRRKLYSLAGADDQEDDEPVWNGRDPEEIVADSSLPARVVLDDILDAAERASTVIEMAESLDVDVDNLSPVCWELTLKQPDSLELVDGVSEQTETIREVAA